MEKSFHGAFLTAFVQLSTCYSKAEHLMLLTLGKTPPFRCCCSSRLEQVRGSKIQHLIVKHKCLPDVPGLLGGCCCDGAVAWTQVGCKSHGGQGRSYCRGTPSPPWRERLQLFF